MSELDAGSRRKPLYRQVADRLQEQIAAGRLRLGDRLPSERTLVAEFGVSRVTLRQSLKTLEERGVIRVDNGLRWVHTTPVARRVEEGRTGLVGFAELAGSRGLTVSSDIVTSATRPATLDESEYLGIAPGNAVHELVRLRRIDGMPVCIDRSIVPEHVAPDLLSVDFSTASLYQTLSDRFGVMCLRAEYALEARPAESNDAAWLDVSTGAAVLEAWQTTYDEKDRIVQLSRMTYRGDRYRFRTTLHSEWSGREIPGRTPAESSLPRNASE